MRRLGIVVCITALSGGSATRAANGGTTDMFEFIIDAIRKADMVAIVEALETQEVAGGEQGYLRVGARLTEVVKGRLSGGSTITIDIAMQGRETPRIEIGTEYLFFLRGDGSGNWRVLDLTRPVSIRLEERERFIENLRRAARLASTTASEAELKRHYLDMLRSGVRFFITDAAKASSTVPSWNDGELQQLIAILNGDGVAERPQGNDHDHLAAVVVQHGSVAVATRFARQELKDGHGDPVYFGLMKRSGQTVDAILAALLRDQDEAIRGEALRVAGLLRRKDLLDQFEKQDASGETWVRQALEQARALAIRD
jgi:hypothetical protein